MKTNPTIQTNETKTTIHSYEQGEDCFPFAILEQTEIINEEGETSQTFEPILGNNRLGTQFIMKEMAEDYIKSKPYELILALIIHTLEMKEKFEKEQQELLKHKQNEVQQ